MTKPFLLNLDLQFFAGGGDEFDLAKFREEFEQSYQEPEETVEELPEDEELEEAEPIGEDELSDEDSEFEEDSEPEEQELEEVEDDEDEPYAPPSPEPQKKKQSKEENAAFAEMRRENERLKQQSTVVEQLAAQYGMSVEQFEAAYRQQQEEAQAQKQGVPVEFLRQMNSQQAELDRIKKESSEQKFWTQVDSVKQKYGLQDDEINGVFDYIGTNGLYDQNTRLPIVDFEFAYKAANFDKVQERKVKEARQKELAAKKKRQSTSAKPHNSNVSPKATSDEIMSDKEVEDRLRAKGFI
jgi:hypothetical protein